MRVKVKCGFKLANELNNTALDTDKIYNGIVAFNQPNYIEDGKIFVEDILLERNDYIVI